MLPVSDHGVRWAHVLEPLATAGQACDNGRSSLYCSKLKVIPVRAVQEAISHMFAPALRKVCDLLERRTLLMGSSASQDAAATGTSPAVAERSSGIKRQRFSPPTVTTPGTITANGGDDHADAFRASDNKRARTETDSANVPSANDSVATAQSTEPLKPRRINILGKGKGRSASSTPVDADEAVSSSTPSTRRADDDMQVDAAISNTGGRPDMKSLQRLEQAASALLKSSEASHTTPQNGYKGPTPLKPPISTSGLTGVNGLPPRPNFTMPDPAMRYTASREGRPPARHANSSDYRDFDLRHEDRPGGRRSPPSDSRRPSSAIVDRFVSQHCAVIAPVPNPVPIYSGRRLFRRTVLISRTLRGQARAEGNLHCSEALQINASADRPCDCLVVVKCFSLLFVFAWIIGVPGPSHRMVYMHAADLMSPIHYGQCG